MPKRKPVKQTNLERLSIVITDWMGTPHSIVVHTLIFVAAFLLIGLGADADTVMLSLTTAVSLEAIYLALFIQMTVNRHSKSLSEVEKDIDEIQEDVEAIEEIQEDVEDITEDIAEDDVQEIKTMKSLETIEQQIKMMALEIQNLKSNYSNQNNSQNQSDNRTV